MNLRISKFRDLDNKCAQASTPQSEYRTPPPPRTTKLPQKARIPGSLGSNCYTLNNISVAGCIFPAQWCVLFMDKNKLCGSSNRDPTREARADAQASLRTRNPSMITLLYEEKGIEAAAKIWREFEKARSMYEEVEDEDREEEEADDERGHGELAEVEGNRRQINGEYELAIRGYGE